MNEILTSILLGVVEGIAECIPVSSTAHLLLVQKLFPIEKKLSSFFTISVQLGSILAICLYNKQYFLKLFLIKQTIREHIKIIFSILPLSLAGLFIYPQLKTYMHSPLSIPIGLIAGSLLMLTSSYYMKKYSLLSKKSSVESITFKDSAIIGILQCLALWPGVSRSGATISAGILRNCSYPTAVSFSFIIAVPVTLLATGYELIKIWKNITSFDIIFVSIGFIVAFITTKLVLAFFVRLICNYGLIPFAIYRLVISSILLIQYTI